jgi:hypothetical protein
MMNLLPSGQNQYMKTLVDGGAESIMPPSKEDVKNWTTFYPMYFNSEFSIKNGRRVSKNVAVVNPRCDEIVNGLKQLGLRSIVESVSKNLCVQPLLI